MKNRPCTNCFTRLTAIVVYIAILFWVSHCVVHCGYDKLGIDQLYKQKSLGTCTDIFVYANATQMKILTHNCEEVRGLRYRYTSNKVYILAFTISVNNGRLHRRFYEPVMVIKPCRLQILSFTYITVCR